MQFDSPHLLPFLPLTAAALALFYYWVLRRKKTLSQRYAQRPLAARLTRGHSPTRQHAKYTLLAAAILLTLFSLARPQYGTQERPLRRRGVEILIAIDTSMSMLAQDIKPNRLDRARQQLRELIQQLQGDNIGIIAFAGIPIVQCPLTSDYSMALNLLDTLQIDTIPVQGTAISKAIEKATQTFKKDNTNQKVLILLTDGEDHETNPLKAAQEAAKAGIIIYAIGIGSTQGTPIPLPQGGYKATPEGKINTRLDFQTLTQIALATNGKAIKANETGNLELNEIEKSINALKKNDLQTTTATQHIERFQYFLIFAIIALAAEMLLNERKRKKTPIPS